VKYCVLIIDGAAGWPLPERGNKTTLELADTPNLDKMAREGFMGMVRTVPPGMEPSSACACMSVLGYDPKVYYRGRSGIEAISLDIPVGVDEVTFRCNLITVQDGKMLSYCAGHISSEEGRELIMAIGQNLGNESFQFYPGVGYRHICKISGVEEVLSATCTPPHDIPNKSIDEFMPHGTGSDMLRELMLRSEDILQGHPLNTDRIARGALPANMIWLFWGSGKIPELPSFKQKYGLDAALTSAVDLLRGLAKMANIDVLDIPGVTDGLDNDYAGQAAGAFRALESHQLVVIHIEAPDEAGHAASIDDKIEAIERVDSAVVGAVFDRNGDSIRIMVLPDHPTPIATQTHSSEPVPFLLWGPGFKNNGAKRYTEKEAKGTGVFIDDGYTLTDLLTEYKYGDGNQLL
jgi:2,3-bisphosphoglycerate-independent phosphoglycerate mutase